MPCTLSEELFENWQATFASRIGREQIPHAAVADYRALCRIFDSDADYHAAAQYVYEHWQSWNAWPAPIEFESARATLRRIPDAEIRAGLKQIAASRALIPACTSTHHAVVDEFADDWRAALAHCSPSMLARQQGRRFQTASGDDPWLTDERRGVRVDDAGSEPPTPPPLDESDAVAR